ncbi:M23 family metallopeptidase [Arthrobacter sp. H14]|uniref:M23 family metallopeptidase n=1 Tax=Arthrobacter sp. H14 TaxID=1312959 RepID=UPI0004B2E067|nr:M23 family metallopeptidase [Arthrobacter sp. H14]
MKHLHKEAVRPSNNRTGVAAIAVVIALSVHVLLFALPAGAQARPSSWDWPVGKSPDVLREFDLPPEPWLSGHRGVDLAASAGNTKVRAPADGTVSFVGWVVDRPVLTLVHSGGLRSSFESVRSDLSKGDTVSQGDIIGKLTKPPHCGAKAECVHWGVRRDETYVNPLQFVTDLRPSVLLPIPG